VLLGVLLFWSRSQNRKPDKMAVIRLRQNPKKIKKKQKLRSCVSRKHDSLLHCKLLQLQLKLKLQFVPVPATGTYKLSSKLENVAPTKLSHATGFYYFLLFICISFDLVSSNAAN